MIEVLSLGAGVQSTAVLLMSLEGELPKLDHAIFADTGWEPRAVYDHLEWLIAEVDGRVPVHVLSAGDIRKDHLACVDRGRARTTIPFYVDTGRREGRTWRKCTREYKLNPIHQFMRRTILGVAKHKHTPAEPVIRSWLGISSDEWRRAKPARERWILNWHPLLGRRISRSGCLAWLRDRGYPEPPRSACIGCPFRSRAEWRRMQQSSPAEFLQACEFDAAMRNHAAISGPAYLHRSLTPLANVDFRSDADRGQQMLWQDECEGICGL